MSCHVATCRTQAMILLATRVTTVQFLFRLDIDGDGPPHRRQQRNSSIEMVSQTILSWLDRIKASDEYGPPPPLFPKTLAEDCFNYLCLYQQAH